MTSSCVCVLLVSGTSNNSCDNNYRGLYPFSEIETQSLARFVCSNNDTIKSYMNIHMSGEMWMYPFGKYNRIVAFILCFIGDAVGHYPFNVDALVSNAAAFDLSFSIFSTNYLSRQSRLFVPLTVTTFDTVRSSTPSMQHRAIRSTI